MENCNNYLFVSIVGFKYNAGLMAPSTEYKNRL